MLPTSKESHITFDKESSSCYSYGLHYLENASGSSNRTKTERQHLYFTTDDEIKEGDWFVNSDEDPIVLKCTENTSMGVASSETVYSTGLSKKIIATTDPKLNLPQPQKSLIEEYCRVGGIDEVDVEYERKTISGEWKDVLLPSEWGSKGENPTRPKVTSNNEIIIHPIQRMESELLNAACELLTELEHHADEEQKEKIEALFNAIKYNDELDEEIDIE